MIALMEEMQMRDCEYMPLEELFFLTDEEEEQIQRFLDSQTQTWDDIVLILTDEKTSDIYVLFKNNSWKRFMR